MRARRLGLTAPGYEPNAGMALITESRTTAVEGLLRRLSVAVKAVALYPPPHPVTDRAIAEFHARLMHFAEAYGPFTVRVTKRTLTVDGTVYSEGVHQALAFALYTRRVATFAIMPSVGLEELAAFVTAIGRDRKDLDASGGVAHLLWQSGIEHIQVVEVSVKSDTPAAGADLLPRAAAPVGIDIGRRLSPLERERVIEILRATPEEGGTLIETLSPAARADVQPDEQAEQVYQTLQHLDRLILDQPAEEQEELSARLADASYHLAEPVRTALDRKLLTRVGEDVTADLLVGHFSSERLAHAVINTVAREKIAEQVAALLLRAHIDRDKARAVLAILDERLRPAGEQPQWLVRAVWPLVQASKPQPEPGLVLDGEIDDEQLMVGDEELASRLAELKAADDARVTCDVIRTLVDVLLADDERQELTDAAGFLETQLPWLIDNQEFGVLAEVLRGVRALAASPADAQREIAARLTQAVATDHVVDKLIMLLWDGRGTPLEEQVGSCLDLMAHAVVGPLVRRLGEEPLAGRRLMLCDLLTAIGRPHVDEIARALTDTRADLVASIVSVLGRLAQPDVVQHLGRVRRHPEYAVRREVVDALAHIGTDEAQTLLVRALDDTDGRIRVRVLGSLNAKGVRDATPVLQRLLAPRDWFNRQFEARQAALAAAERFGDARLLPVVTRLARRRLCLGAQGRELRRLAEAAEAAIRARHADPAAGARENRL
jgi:hypothetical protein